MAGKQAPEETLVEKLLGTKLRDFPKDFYASFVVGDYEVAVDLTEGDQPQVLVRLAREGYGKNSELDIRDPDPELTVGDVLKRAKEVIEPFVRKQ
jgi:hypothetical protein